MTIVREILGEPCSVANDLALGEQTCALAAVARARAARSRAAAERHWRRAARLFAQARLRLLDAELAARQRAGEG